MPFQKLDCLRIYVPNLKKGEEFYSKKLGLQVKWRSKKEIGFVMEDGVSELVIQNIHNFNETDIMVDNVESSIQDILEAGGNVIKDIFDIKIGKCAIVEDPWGNNLTILDSSKGKFVTDNDGNIIDQQ